jgi:hypothetical protein
MRRAILAAAATAAVVAATAGPASASVRSCYAPTSLRAVNVYDLSARNMSCGAAVQVINGGHGGSLDPRRWTCRDLSRLIQIDGTVGGTTTRCTLGSEAFRFSWAT